MSGERRRILDMLAEDRITVDQAEALLLALDGNRQGQGAATPPPGPDAPAGAPPARSLQVVVQKGKGRGGANETNITVPLGLARFASRFLPESLRDELDDQDVDIDDVLEALSDDGPLPAGSVLIDIRSGDDSYILVKAV